MAAAADWSQLPKELLHLISERLDTPLHLLRFRSVCSAWRSSSPPIIPNQHFPFTVPPLSTHNASTSSISKRTLFLITPPPPLHRLTQTPWLVKTTHDPHGGTHLCHPLFRDLHLLSPSLRLLDLFHLRISHLGNEFRHSHNNFYMEKVVAAATSAPKEGFILLTVHVSGELALFRRGDESWTVIPDAPIPPHDYHDVCFFNNRPYAVDGTGRIIVVRPDSALELVADSVFGGEKKFLVESGGELLLVDMHLSPDCFRDGDEVYSLGWEKPMSFDVFRLDEKEKRWVKITSLGDRVLFLGDDCTFSASASDLCLGRGNCVVFSDDALECGMGVFPLDVGRISPLSDLPDYSMLFWPPPNWVRLHCH